MTSFILLYSLSGLIQVIYREYISQQPLYNYAVGVDSFIHLQTSVHFCFAFLFHSIIQQIVFNMKLSVFYKVLSKFQVLHLL